MRLSRISSKIKNRKMDKVVIKQYDDDWFYAEAFKGKEPEKKVKKVKKSKKKS